MKLIYNKYIPVGKFVMMAFYGLCFVRKGYKPSETGLNEERIHSAQQVEVAVLTAIILSPFVASTLISVWWLLLIPLMYFILYVLFWFAEVLLPPYGTAYHDTCFEREAKLNRGNHNYIYTRSLCAWVKYFKKDRK